MPFTGSCLCKSVRYEIDSLDSPIAHCHCITCRKAHAAAFATTARVMRDHFRWTAGEDRLRSFESSAGKFRHFCSACGTHLIAERPVQSHVILRVPTLDDDPGVKPVMHIWTSHDAPWLQDPEAIAHHREWPPGH
ncbi:Aldehyde-activating protein [Paraburkholderia tropica]|uniref:GFA family protein n=1 Tax=Paraburkholderia tropica TaxID=92647 RepID=UPI001CB0E367|nr:GFA family protein [Paraburkholderia tropica]CAG9238983.1 Aldehyde-activating protein [Paraburkholderia tropica]